MDYLASLGYDVWVADMRGNGLADKQRRGVVVETQWNIDDHLVQVCEGWPHKQWPVREQGQVLSPVLRIEGWPDC